MRTVKGGNEDKKFVSVKIIQKSSGSFPGVNVVHLTEHALNYFW